jgi:hypothetical protein
MAYSQFTYDKIRKELGIQDIPQLLFTDIHPILPSNWLIETLKKGESMAYFSEKSRSEAVIFPILLEVWERNQTQFSIYSGPDLEVDTKRGLSGECDFILGRGYQKIDLDAPLFCMIEAKDQDMKKAIPQCIAQMEAARIFNEQRDTNIPTMWGCVTTGEVWLFLKLVEKTVYIDTHRYQSANLSEILGVMQAILGQI